MVMVELQRRQALLDRAGLEDIERWNAVHPDEPLPYILVVVDEVAELSAVESKR
jgi:S-DNA-T family DNA segregation ATPase FtsK/SpoIIIE